jgi:DNA uptake protein ComE-like DNA-binding protein
MKTAYKTFSALSLTIVLLAGLTSNRAAAAAKMDLNTAPETSLMQMPNVNKQIAQRIIAHRPYASVNELSKAGIRNATMLSKIAEFCIQPFDAAAASRGAGGGGGTGGGNGADFGGVAGRR